MRQMKKGNIIINVVEHIITKGHWEYYVTDDKEKSIVRCLVQGFETELGDVCFTEIKPFIITRTKKLNEILPAIGWEWID